MSSQAARELANRRWRDPEVVDQRVNSLVEDIRTKVGQLPPLTSTQKAKLAALLREVAR